MKKTIKILLTFLLFASSLFASSISFSAGYTTLSMKEGNQNVSLSNGSKVTLDNLDISADQINLSGEDYKYIECINFVKFIDKENEITLRCSNLKFNQDNQTIIINGWCEIDDKKNNIYATSSYLEYNLENKILDLMIEVKLLHDSDNKIMKCSSDSLRFDLKNNILALLGSSQVLWDSNTYKAQAMTINLNNNDISMDGNIEANITSN